MRRWLCSLIFLMVSSGLRADPNSEATLIARARQEQAARQWGYAVRDFLEVLKENPRDLWVYQKLGNIYYTAGDRRGALAYYRRYLLYYPSDLATRKFADQLEQSMKPQATAPPVLTAPSSSPHGGWDLRLGAGIVSTSGEDVASLYSGPGLSASVSGSYASLWGGAVDYAWENGFLTGLEIWDGPSRAYSISSPDGSETSSLTIDNFSVLLSPGWRFRLEPCWLLEPRLGLGYMSSSVNSLENGSSQNASASTWLLWPQVRGEWVFGSWGIGLTMGYLFANASPVTDSQGNPVQQVSQDGTESNWGLENGGFSVSLDLAYHFQAPF